MPLRDALLPELEMEMAGTRKTLERVPQEKFEWRPHDKSTKMGPLAMHLAQLPAWVAVTLNEKSMDLEPVGGPAYTPAEPESSRQVLETFDRGLAEAREALNAVQDAKLFESWSLLRGGKTLFTLPKIAVLRSFVLNHNVHHRAQLGVYLRMNDIPVPSLYGPSADEAGM